MQEQVFCRRCHQPIEQKRDDKQFCSDKCASAWAREQGYYRERFHTEKPEWIKKNCEWCNTIFEYNEYAMRGGQRVPKFCSNGCRQAAYRARKAEQGQHAGYTGNWDDARQDKTETKAQSNQNARSRKGTSQGEKTTGKKSSNTGKGTSQDTGTNEQQWNTYEQQAREQEQKEKVRNEERAKHQRNSDKGTSQSGDKGTQQPPLDKRWKSNDAYEVLGVTYLTNLNEIKKMWKKLLRTYHPDVNTDPNAGSISKKINWAWDKIEKSHPRR